MISFESLVLVLVGAVAGHLLATRQWIAAGVTLAALAVLVGTAS